MEAPMLAAGTTLGPYKILAPLGAGGMGEVYRAHDTRLGRDVAIKVLPQHLAATPEVRARFEREARTISQLNHPHICTLHDVGHQDGTDYLVMELLEGDTLAHRLEKGALPVAEVLSLGRQIAEALDRAHRAGVVHRDLKPGNIMLTKSGAKLMDFGLARAHGMAAAASAMSQSPTVSRPLTAEGTIVGTFQYMAPEQLEGKEADARSDLWALGCVLYEMATGARAFAGESQASLIAAIMTGEPRAMTELRPVTPPALERVVRRCLAKDPDGRFQSASDLAFDLEGVGDHGSIGVAVAGHMGAPGGRPGGSRNIGIIAVVGVLLVAVITFVTVRRDRPADTSHLTCTRLTVHRGFATSARFAPDGQTIYYSASLDGRPPDIFETRPGFPVSRSLGLSGTRLLSISRDGRMAILLGVRTYSGSGTLAEVPLAGGTPRQILEGVTACDWAPDGKAMVVAHRVGDRTRLEMPIGRILYETDAFIWGVRVSRSGELIVFDEHPMEGSATGRLLILDRRGKIVSRTADELFALENPNWSPDGREAWFRVSKDGGTSELRALSPGGRERVVARFPGVMFFSDIAPSGKIIIGVSGTRGFMFAGNARSGGARDVSWFDGSNPTDISRDGQTLLFRELGAYGGPYEATCIRGMDGSPPVKLGAGAACALSPDGKWALAIHAGPPQQLLLLPTGAGDSTALPHDRIENYLGAGWMPDGQHVVFAGSERGHAPRIYLQPVTGGSPTAITAEGMIGWRVSPDGQFVAATSKDRRLQVCAVAGGSARVVAELLPDESVLQWTTDGRGVYVGGPGFGSMAVSVVDLATGSRSTWGRFGVPDSTGVEIGSGVLTPDGRSFAFSFVRRSNVLYLAEGLK